VLRERLQSAVQRGLAESAAARALCAQLAGRSLRIVVRHTTLAATIRSDGQTLLLDACAGGASPAAVVATADATLTGSALGLLAMLRADRSELVQHGVVELGGDPEIAARFARLLSLLRPDLESLLGQAVGRAPAHLVAGGLQQLRQQGAALLGNLAATTADYLAHERRELVTGAEAQQFYREVDELQQRVARLEAVARARRAGGAAP
jgi:ubiquinone biosynthesis protein UbiJ